MSLYIILVIKSLYINELFSADCIVYTSMFVFTFYNCGLPLLFAIMSQHLLPAAGNTERLLDVFIFQCFSFGCTAVSEKRPDSISV